MYTCPRCDEPGIPGWRRWTLGPAVPTRCTSCRGTVGVPWKSLVSMIPLAITLVASGFLKDDLTAILLIVVGGIVSIAIWPRFAPLVPR